MRDPDILIIGSGVAGAAVASRLLKENPDASILMLEAGPRVKMRDFALHQHYLVTGKLPYEFCEDQAYPTKDSSGENESVGSTLIPMQGSRLMMYGGSTVHWGGWSFRLKPEDFRLASGLLESGAKLDAGYDIIDWPISYADLEPYYCEAEEYIGVSGDSTEQRDRSKPYPFQPFPYTLEDKPAILAMHELGIGYGHMPIARHGMADTESPHAPCQTTGTCKYCPFGARFVAANYIDDMRKQNDYPNFEVALNVVVERLLFSARGTVSGVEIIDKNVSATQRSTVNAGLVIVTAGAVESSKLLLRGEPEFWPDGVGNDNGLVGRNLITHPYIIFEADLAENPDRLMAEMDFPTLVSRNFDSEEEQAAGKYIIVNPCATTGVKMAQSMQQGLTVEQVRDRATGETRVQLHVLLEIFSRNRNRLYNSQKNVNHVGLRETVIDFDQGPDFDVRVAEIKAQIDAIFRAMGARDTRVKTISWRADHAASTMRMSADPETGTVDSDLKVFGVENLYICSNAAFSSLGAVNPTLTLTSLALRLGDHLNQKVLVEHESAADTLCELQ